MANLLSNTTIGGYQSIHTGNIGSYALTSITSGQVTTALGFTPYNATNPSGYISSITSGNVTTALGYTPYNATNPSGYITSSGSISGNATTATTAARATRANGNFYIDDNYGNTVVGNYASTRYQGVFAMGDSYKLPADGTTTGNLYGLAWSHPNAGGVASNLNDHGLLVINNGVFAAAISSSIRAAADMRAPIFYDSADTTYYLDPNSTTSLRTVGSWRSDSSTWDGEFSGKIQYHSSNWYIQAADSLLYRNGGGTNVFLVNQAGDATAIGSMRSPIFYDSQNTNYYGDFAGTSRFNIAQLNSIADQSYTRIVNPEGAFSVNNSPQSGAIKIKLPVAASFSNSMMSFTIQIYNYSTGTSRTIRCGGYTYYTTDWYNTFAFQIGDTEAGNLTIRFGKDSTGACVWVGETNSYWDYPNVFVTDVQSGHNQPTSMATGWSVTMVTSFDTIQTSRVAYSQITSGNIASQSVSYATTAGALSSMNISQFTNNSGYLTGITSGQVTGALGYTPYNSSNPSGYITSSSLSSYLPLSGGIMTGKILSVSTGSGTYDTAIEIREQGYVTTSQSAWGYSPAMTFHWGGRYGVRFGLRSDGLMAVDDAPIALRSWVSAQGFITGYTETDTLASVTGRGGTTATPITISTGSSQPLSLTTANGSPWHLALNRTDLGLTSRVFAHDSPYNGWYFEHNISIAGNTNWHSGNLTNLNQLSNGPGYITSITSGNVTTALGYTPYNASNPSGYITSSGSISGNAATTSQKVFNDLKIDFPSGGSGGYSFGPNHYSMGLDLGNGAWSHPHYKDLIIGYHTGIRLGASYSGIRFYNNSPTTDTNNDGNGDSGEALLMTIGGYVGTANYTDVVVNNNLIANVSLRAPIFYDSNDTSYYLDPNGNSVLTTATFNVNASSTLILTSAGTNASQIKAGAGDELYIGGNNSWQMRFSGANVLMDNGGYLQNNESLRAPIFYDSQDTNYYVDPNGMSKQVQLTNLGTYGSNAANARNHFVQYNAGNAGIAGGWIAAAFGDATAARVVIGQSSSITEAIIGSHNGNLTDWGALGYVATTHKFYAPSWTSAVQLEVNTNGVYAPAYRGNANVGGTGSASWHPDGIYCGSTMWQYGAQYKNNTGIYDVSEIKMYSGPYLQTYNTRNLIVRALDSNDAVGILGQKSGAGFAFQLYGDGSSYGFLNGAWAGWDIRKAVSGAMYMNNDNSYYLQTNGTSNFYALNIQGNAVVHTGNIGSQSVSYASSAGTANAVAWTNVSSRPTALSQFTNDLGNYGGFLTSITAHSHAISDVTGLQTALDSKQASLGFTPYNSTNPSGYITSSGSISGNAATATIASTVTVNSGNSSAAWYPIVWHSGNTVYSSSGAEIYAAGNYIRCQYINTTDNDESGITRFVIKNGDSYHRSATTTVAADIIRGVASGTWSINVTGSAGSVAWTNVSSRPTALSQFSNDLGNYGGWITGINSGNVTTALGFTPYNATNPSGYITSSASISGNAATATNVAWTGVTGRPTALSQFSNDLGNYGGWLTTGGKAADSELFDGTDSIYFVKGNGTNALGRTTTNNSGGNSAGGLSSGFYDGSGMSNMPTSDWYHLIVNSHHNSATSNQYEFQLATAFWDKSNFYVRSISPGDVGPWRTLIHNGNIGSQSVSYATTSQQLNKYGDISGQDWNTYYINGKMIVSSVYGGSGPNFPTGAYNYGAMLSYGVTGSEFFQVYFPENGALQGGAFRKLHYRTGWNGSWSAWKSVVDQEGQVCTIAGSNQTGIEIHSNVGYNQDPLTYFLIRGQADTSWKALKIRLTGDAGGQDIEFRRIAENGTDSRMWYVPRGANTVNFDYPIVQPSDSRLKDNITPISTPVDKIKSLRGVEFDWNSGEQVGTHDVGLIAQDVEAVLPEAVTTQEDGYKNLAYTKVIPLLVEAMKEQQATIEALRAEIELLKNK